MATNTRSIDLGTEITFMGETLFGDTRTPAIAKTVTTKRGLGWEVFFPFFGTDEKIPARIEGEAGDWKITIQPNRATHGDFHNFEPLSGSLGLGPADIEAIPQLLRQKPWQKMTVRPRLVDFCRKDWSLDVPDEWGVTFYPEEAHKAMSYLIHEGSKDCPPLPSLFAGWDDSAYFRNVCDWSTTSMLDRMDLITSVLTLFAGSPLSYDTVIGRCGEDVKFVRMNFIINPSYFICPGPSNGHASIRDDFLVDFRARFVKMIEQIYNYDTKRRERLQIALKYFEELHHALYKETRCAFSFQLMEAIIQYGGNKLHLPNSKKKDDIEALITEGGWCADCLARLSSKLPAQTDDFDQYVEESLRSISDNGQIEVSPQSVMEIARIYRNNVFHGGFFEAMDKVDLIIEKLPKGYRDNLAAVLQGVACILGAHFLLELPFELLTAYRT